MDAFKFQNEFQTCCNLQQIFIGNGIIASRFILYLDKSKKSLANWQPRIAIISYAQAGYDGFANFSQFAVVNVIWNKVYNQFPFPVGTSLDVNKG